jgi:CubicO group peptidase (beta-lactamase class C family)
LPALAVLLALAAASSALAADGPPACDIPRLDGIAIDGALADWQERGLRVEAMAADDGQMKPPADLDATFRLGWNEEGLLVFLTVRDSAPRESPSVDTLYEQDSVELFYAPENRAPGEFCQVIISPGCDPRTPEVRQKLYDQRRTKASELSLKAARASAEGGYLLELLLPWRNLGVTPASGAKVWFGLWVNDADHDGGRFQVAWTPRTDPVANSQAAHLLRLSGRADAPVTAAVRAGYRNLRWAQVDLSAREAMAGRSVELRSAQEDLARGSLVPREGLAVAQLRLPLPPRGQPLPSLAVLVDGHQVAVAQFPDLEEARARAALDLRLAFHPFAFGGTSFPPSDFAEPSLAEDVLGPYTLKRTFYDAAYQPVTTADKPGRYGAVVEVIPAEGRPLTLYRTLLRLPDGVDLGFYPRNPSFAVQLPVLPGVDPAILQANATAINEAVQRSFMLENDSDPIAAIMLAGLLEAKPADPPATVQDDLFARDRQWWVGLKRRLYGMEQRRPADFVCPRPKEGAPAPVLRQGTLAEAGMRSHAADKLDALLTRWAADSDQGFAVLVARHGVVVLDKAYGQRDGHPMSVTDKSWMASISKLIAGAAMMMAVDQGRVNLDDPVSDYLPAFRDARTDKVLTVRHLYNHTSGLWGHWGDEMHDFDQLIGWYAPHLKVGLRYDYNGAGLALGGKVLEIVSGEATPLYYKHHLLDPLGCVNTDILGCSWDARSTARDIATIAQMLLNKGAYGNMRFMREETAAQMLPVKITRLVPGDTTTEYGVGTSFFRGDGLGEGTWGHGAASSATLRIDPANDLVVVMTRDDAGRNFGAYHSQFLKLVADEIAR